VSFAFEADSQEAMRGEAATILQTCGRDVEVFSVMNEAGNVVMTDEDLV
jgi:hypothetical protein